MTAATETMPTLRTVYTPAQFAAEVLGKNRSRRWVADECRARRIKTVDRRTPYLIPGSEARRFIGGGK